jgi:membrane-bound metal-dependent hydrolase YbcI (DUF457 family)
MKGIIHFLTGVAVATCFPEVLDLARAGSLLPVVGGVAGLLPDTLDFRFVRYWERFDVEVDPASVGAEGVADALAAAMRGAYEGDTPQRAIVHTVRLGANRWRRYTLRFDAARREVGVRAGPVVTTGQVAYPGSEPEDAAWAVRHLDFPFISPYSDVYHVDIFTGPSFRFEREPNVEGEGAADRLVVHFLDWHHRWTHSLILALLVGLVLGAAVGLLWGWDLGLMASAVAGLAFAAHVVEDQLGHMGSNLFWPLTRRRIPGLGLLHASDAAPNVLAVWTALAVILFNLDRLGGPGLLPSYYMGLVVGAPWAVLGLTSLLRRRERVGVSPAEARVRERGAEAMDSDG